jgi:hypothetical protein
MSTFSIILTILLYVLIGYLSFGSAFILYNGLKYRLILSVGKSLAFIILAYISIISDVILFGNFMYTSLIMKNGLLLALLTTSLRYTVSRKETDHEHTRK